MSFQAGLSGLNAAATKLGAVGNNIANVDTIGFKSANVQFASVVANALNAQNDQVGIGVRVAGVVQEFTQGNIEINGNPLSVAINGQGFFRLEDNGVISFSRNGQFSLDNQGYIVNNSGRRLTGYGVDSTGAIAAGTPVDLRVSNTSLSPTATTQVNANLNLDSRLSPITTSNLFDPAVASTYSNATSVTVFDSLGNPKTLSLYFIKTASNKWQIAAADNGVALAPAAVAGPPSFPAGYVGTVDFNSAGALTTSPPQFNISIPASNGGAAIAIQLDLNGSSQFGAAFGVNSIYQDGFTAGTLAGFNIGPDGVILGRYNNGRSFVQGQIVLAQFTNSQGLASIGDNQWSETSASGSPSVGAPGSSTLGLLQSGALEASNVDLTKQLVDLITTQRNFQANAKTISALNEVLQTVIQTL